MVKIANIELGEFPLLLAPMEDVSDPPFRMICKSKGADMMYTEFISSEALIRDAEKSIRKLDIYDEERPIGIQIFGGNLDAMKQSADIVTASNPDLLDINYGCPVKKVTCKGGGSAILQDIPKMVHMTSEIVKSTNLPVTVKTRLGWDENSLHIVEVAERLQDVGIKAISIHGRTRKQMYKGDADWSLIAQVKNNPRMFIPVFGNGDVNTPEQALEKRNTYGVDGIMIGRASIGHPWIFDEIKHYMATGEHLPPPSLEERISTCREHLKTSMRWKGDKRGILEMRRHYANYFKGFPGIKDFRQRLVSTDSFGEIEGILQEIHVIYQNTDSIAV